MIYRSTANFQATLSPGGSPGSLLSNDPFWSSIRGSHPLATAYYRSRKQSSRKKVCIEAAPLPSLQGYLVVFQLEPILVIPFSSPPWMDPNVCGIVLGGRRLRPGCYILRWRALVRRMLDYDRVAHDWGDIAMQLLELASQ